MTGKMPSQGPSPLASSLTWVPQKLHPDAHSPALAPRHPTHIYVTYAGVGTLPQPQLRNHVLHLREIGLAYRLPGLHFISPAA